MPLLGGCVAALLTVWLAGCKRPAGNDSDDGIHKTPIIYKDPNAEAPNVIFPEQFKTEDVALNEFIRKALESCKTGDYDKFRQLFGVASDPPAGAQFDRVWKGVKEIRVAGMYQGPQRPPEYYVHVVVQLRQPDRHERTERQAVIVVFQEGGEWRLAPAPSEIQGQILYADTQPASGPSAATRPARRHAASRAASPTTSPAK
jgi:hypothetical protein